MLESVIAFLDSGPTLVVFPAYLAVCIGFIFAATYAITTLQFVIGSSGNYYDLNQTTKPLTVPYFIPFVAGALSMMDQHRLHAKLARTKQAVRPLRLRVGPTDIYFAYGPDNLRNIFQNSKNLVMERRIVALFEANRVPAADLDIISSDKSGYETKPRYDIEPEKRVWRNTSTIFRNDLATTAATEAMARRFEQQLIQRLAAQANDDYQSVALYKFLKEHMVYATGVSLTGEEIFKHNPQFHKTLWAYDEAFLMLGLPIPEWLAPRIYAARDAMKEAMVTWYQAAYAKDDFTSSGDPEWEPVWGSRFWRHFVRQFFSAGMTVEGAASSSMTTIWATHSNAIPGATWLLFEILQRPALKEDILAELATAMTGTSPPSFDTQKLLNLPLLNSVWKEVLRIRVSTIVYRETEAETLVNNTIIPKGAILMAPTWPAHTHPAHWGISGTAPPTEFDPGRALALEKQRQASKADRDRAAAALSPNNMFPWGGGSHMCPGRFFAKQEIFIAAAVVLAGFDVEVVRWEHHAPGWPDEPRTTGWREWLPGAGPRGRPDRPARGDEAYAGGGVMPPDRDLRVRMKRKAWWCERGVA